uniref:ABC transporter permease n=1 Tax=Aestuariivirga sp. TaxID=2650926 RepID=UPI0035930CA6
MTAAAISGRTWTGQWRRWAPVAVLAGLCIIIGLFNPNFFGVSNIVRMLNTAAIPLVICMGTTFIILMGSIDLSAEGVIAICAVAASMLVANDFTGIAIGLWSVPAAILVGGAIGLLNGLVHVRLKVPSFMTTLGIGFAAVGVATAILGGVMVRVSDTGFRDALSLGRVLGIPAAV